MAVYINRLNGGSITVGSGGSPTPAGHPETRFTLEGGTVETHNITGALDFQWMVDNGYYDAVEYTWLETISQVDIGNTVTSIGGSTFMNNINLAKVTIPSTVTSIGQEAFLECNGLTSITVLGKTTAEAQTLLADAAVPAGCQIVGELD